MLCKTRFYVNEDFELRIDVFQLSSVGEKRLLQQFLLHNRSETTILPEILLFVLEKDCGGGWGHIFCRFTE